MVATPKILATGALVFAACSSSGGPKAPTDSFDRPAMLRHLANEVLVPLYNQFQSDTSALSLAVDTYCATTAPFAQELAAAQSAWTVAMGSWQRVSAMMFGPANMNAGDIRLRIYSWPLVQSCAVDQQVAVFQANPDGVDVATVLNNRRGLDTLEYLLFATTLDHSCPSTVAPAGWNALADDLRHTARCEYARQVANDVNSQAEVIVNAWSPGGGNYANELATAGAGSTVFDTAQQAVNVVSDALFYLDIEVKDSKIGKPVGLVANKCGAIGTTCPAELESVFADQGSRHIQSNLAGFALLFTGGPGSADIGFDDFLIELGAADLAQTMLADIATADAAAQALPGSMVAGITDDAVSIEATFSAVQNVTINLKSQFLTVLGLDIPSSAAGDND